MVCRLFAGGNRIRAIGPAPAKGLSAVAEGRCRTDKLDGLIKHRSSRETTMVGRGPLSTAVFLGGTDGSNPVPSSGESGENAGLTRDRPRTGQLDDGRCGRGTNIHNGIIGAMAHSVVAFGGQPHNVRFSPRKTK
jgi:hypothetical protein